MLSRRKIQKPNNGSSKKADLIKLKESAEEKGKIPIYAYWEDRRKNDYMKDGVRHLHGIAIFRFLGIEDQWEDFLSHINDVTLTIKEELTKKFDEHYKSPINTSV